MGAALCLAFIWGCVALCGAKRPKGISDADQVAWLVYSRLMAARERMVLLAIVATGCVLFYCLVNRTHYWPDPCRGTRYGDHFC